MAANPHPRPTTVEEIFSDFKGRRAGLVKALTVDFKEFYQQCDPGRENLCLYGHPNETWEVKPPVEVVPSELPEPAVGINFARSVMLRKDWLSHVAAHSDSWLLSVAFYFGGRLGIGMSDRMRLFEMINDHPTVYEDVVPRAVKQVKSQQMEPVPNVVAMSAPKEEEVKQGSSLCGACGKGNEEKDEFWICCDACKGWFHGKCVKITPAEAQNIEQYKCPTCNNKRA